MKEDPILEMALLFDFYGDTLTEKQKQIFTLHYEEDLSLGEIGQIVGITRQGVRDALMRSEQSLRTLEEQTGLISRFRKLESQLKEVHTLSEDFARSADFRHITNDNADRIRRIWHISQVGNGDNSAE